MKQTERKLQLALGKLLTNAYRNRNWSKEILIHLASKENIARTEASRFHQALVDMNLIKFDNLRQTYVANFNVIIWSNEDAKLNLVRSIMEAFPIRLHGKVKKSHKSAKKVEIITVPQTETTVLSQFSSVDLVRELRNRGYEVKASKVITTVEEL